VTVKATAGASIREEITTATRAVLLSCLTAAQLVIAAPALAAEPGSSELSDDGARVTRLAESVYVIDSCYLPSRTRADIALIRRITDKLVRYLMTTHWHFDHNNGAIAYHEAFPDVTLIASGSRYRTGVRPIRRTMQRSGCRARVPEWGGPDVTEDDWTYTRRTLAERAFVGLRGQGGL
jgi:glyoxylase-like metal-dependent hydrolase (beta-lactamase superfamily II)